MHVSLLVRRWVMLLMGVRSKVFQQEIPDFQWEEGIQYPFLYPRFVDCNAGFARTTVLFSLPPIRQRIVRQSR